MYRRTPFARGAGAGSRCPRAVTSDRRGRRPPFPKDVWVRPSIRQSRPRLVTFEWLGPQQVRRGRHPSDGCAEVAEPLAAPTSERATCHGVTSTDQLGDEWLADGSTRSGDEDSHAEYSWVARPKEHPLIVHSTPAQLKLARSRPRHSRLASVRRHRGISDPPGQDRSPCRPKSPPD